MRFAIALATVSLLACTQSHERQIERNGQAWCAQFATDLQLDAEGYQKGLDAPANLGPMTSADARSAIGLALYKRFLFCSRLHAPGQKSLERDARFLQHSVALGTNTDRPSIGRALNELAALAAELAALKD